MNTRLYQQRVEVPLLGEDQVEFSRLKLLLFGHDDRTSIGREHLYLRRSNTGSDELQRSQVLLDVHRLLESFIFHHFSYQSQEFRTSLVILTIDNLEDFRKEQLENL